MTRLLAAFDFELHKSGKRTAQPAVLEYSAPIQMGAHLIC
jgi:hypothetical protein